MRHLPLAALFAVLPLAAHADGLALRRVLLSTGGVGYFEYAAEVDGAADLDLDVQLDQVDDVLPRWWCSTARAAVGGVELPGATMRRARRSPTCRSGRRRCGRALDYLNSLQGVDARGEGPAADDRASCCAPSGRASRCGPPGPQATVRRTRVTLLTAAGLQQFVLEDADSVQVADAGAARRIETGAGGGARRRRRRLRGICSLRSTGDGHRDGAGRLRRRGAAVEDHLPPGAARRRGGDGAAARLGGAGERVRRRLERRRAGAAVRQSGDVPAGAVSQLLRAASGGAGGGARPHPAGCGYRRIAAAVDAAGRRPPPASRATAGAMRGAGRSAGRRRTRCSGRAEQSGGEQRADGVHRFPPCRRRWSCRPGTAPPCRSWTASAGRARRHGAARPPASACRRCKSSNDTATSLPAGVLTLVRSQRRRGLCRRRAAGRPAGGRKPAAGVRRGPAHGVDWRTDDGVSLLGVTAREACCTCRSATAGQRASR